MLKYMTQKQGISCLHTGLTLFTASSLLARSYEFIRSLLMSNFIYSLEDIKEYFRKGMCEEVVAVHSQI